LGAVVAGVKQWIRGPRVGHLTKPAQVWRAVVAVAFWLAILYALFG
jgi:hypothetical protein